MSDFDDASQIPRPSSGEAIGAHGFLKPEKEPVTDDLAEAPKYYIRRASDDLIIAICADVEQSVPLSDEKTLACAISNTEQTLSLHHYGHVRDSRTITIAHHGGDRFMIPWMLCTKWIWMKEIIKLTYGSNESAKKNIDEGKFELSESEWGSRILVDHWETFTEPWQFVIVKLKPDSDDSMSTATDNLTANQDKDTSPKSNTKETVYEALVKYRIDFYLQKKAPPGYPQGQETFRECVKYDVPVTIEKSGSREDLVPVIEEINHITLESEESLLRQQQNDILTNGLDLDPNDKVKPKKLHIKSPHLLNSLRSIVRYSSNPPSSDDTEVFTNGIFPFPFKDLYHHRQQLLDFKNETSGPRANHTPEYNSECDRHIDILIDYLDNEPTVQLKSVEERWMQKVPVTTFAGFWLLMKPGADVYVQENGQLNAYVVDWVAGGIDYNPLLLNAKGYTVHVWHLIFDGKVIKRRSKSIEVPIFDGERDIISLPLFPTSFHDRTDGGKLRGKLIERGHKCFQFSRGPTFLEYTGTGLKPGWKKYNQARVVVEHQSLPWLSHEFSALSDWHFTFNRTGSPHLQTPPPPPPPPPTLGVPRLNIPGLGERARVPRCECPRCRTVDSREGTYISPTFSNYDNIDPSRAEGLSEHQALVCMSHMFGFVLKDRNYDILDVSCLSEPKLADSAIDELVLRPEKNKSTIKAIARTYTESDSQADLFSVDFIRGKGEGQIFLLHGPPGTGKTLTAESVAEYTKRPLLSITAADLGHEPVELERNLLRFFKNATAWDAIVLLDEADIYLERRSPNDLRRNSIVSIFLRALDYFEGILFFTTNRVGQFDEAFMSRIHVAIGYDPLDDKAREQVWTTLFRKLKENFQSGGPKIDYEYDAKQYVRKSEDVKRLQWNGREIRNAFQTAVALAIADSKTAKEKGRPESDCIPQVTEAHLGQVVDMSAGFKRYIKATHEDIDDSDLAFRLGNRNDRLMLEGD